MGSRDRCTQERVRKKQHRTERRGTKGEGCRDNMTHPNGCALAALQLRMLTCFPHTQLAFRHAAFSTGDRGKGSASPIRHLHIHRLPLDWGVGEEELSENERDRTCHLLPVWVPKAFLTMVHVVVLDPFQDPKNSMPAAMPSFSWSLILRDDGRERRQ